MAINVSVETPIAFGLTLTVCLVLFFYCWHIRKIRNRLTRSTVQVSALPIAESTVPAEEQTGIKKEVIATFPTVKAHELKDDIKEGCPICLVEYADAEVLRKLPLCGHVFHIRCVDSWLENQVTCPVCRIVLTGVLGSKLTLSSTAGSPAAHVTVEVPAWVLVNRPVPLPPAIADSSPSPQLQSSRSLRTQLELPADDDHLGVSPLLEHGHTPGWGAVYLENHPHRGFTFRTSPQLRPGSDTDTAIQANECIHHDASISERWMTESFVFGISGFESDQSSSKPARTRKSWRSDDSSSSRHASWSSRSVNSPSWDLNQPTMLLQQQHSQDELEEGVEVVESSRVAPFRPLTMSPERCSFEFLPIVTCGPAAGDSSFRSPRSGWVGPSLHSFYS